MAIADYQFELDPDDSDLMLTIGAGTNYSIDDVVGVDGPTNIRSGDITRGGADGSHPGTDFLGTRTVLIFGYVIATTRADLETRVQALRTALQPGSRAPFTVRYQRPGSGTKRFTAKAKELSREWTGPTVARFVARLDAADDPRIYDDALVSDTVLLETASTSGVTLPATLPWVMPAAESGLVDATNNGSYPAPWTASITGPVTTPRITHVASGALVELGLTLATSADFVDLDSLRGSVLLQGTADRSSTVTIGSLFFDLPVGSNSVRFSASSGTGALQFDYRHTYA